MKFLLIILITCFCSVFSIAQRAIGASYSMRVFPFQHFRNENCGYYYNTNYDTYNLKVSNAFENVAKVYYMFSSKTKDKFYTLGINTYSSTLDFSLKTNSSHGEAGVQGSSGTHNEDLRSATYNYRFIGVDFGRLKYIPISEKFSFNLGYALSVNFLVYEKTSNKLNTATSTFSEHYFDGTNNHYSSTTTTSTNDDVADLHNVPFNIKFELPFGFAYQANANRFQILTIFGLSTQSRMLVNPNGLNLYFSPQISYTRLLQKRVKPIKA